MRQWIERARHGDQSAWEHLVRHFSGMAFSVAYAKLGDWSLAEETVQEAFTEAFANLDKLQEAEAFPGWFKVIVERKSYRLLRRKKPATAPLDQALAIDAEDFDVELIAERKERYQKLHQTIEGLSAPLKLAVQLYYFQGYSIGEISSYLSVSPSVLKKRLFDARNKLKSALLVTDLVSMFNDFYEGGQSMLHIVNGDHTGDKLRKGNIRGDILVWREIYPVGPAFFEMNGEEQRASRADYLEHTLGIPAENFIAGCRNQEQVLHNFSKYDEIVLWFEHDLFDQLMLSCLLNWFSKQSLGNTKLNLLCIGGYPGVELFRGLGQLTAKQLEKLSGTWQRIGERELETGRKIWEAYASPDVTRHVGILHEDTSALPFAQAALEMHLSRLPSAMNGLGIVEQATLGLVRSGINKPRELFKEIGKQLSTLGIGDLEFWYRLKQMSEPPNALLEIQHPFSFPDYQRSASSSFDKGVVALTGAGSDVWEGVKDWVTLKEIDEWYGGLRLHGELPWRWDAKEKQLVYIK